jgi:hypothetical protein
VLCGQVDADRPAQRPAKHHHLAVVVAPAEHVIQRRLGIQHQPLLVRPPL